MPASDFKDALKQQADIVRIVGDYVKLKKAGAQNFSGLCPFHNEKTPSFSVHATRQFFHCFGCGVSGDVFSFVQKVENITFPEAVRLIAQKLGVPMPKVEFSSPQEAREAKLRMALLDVHERACAFFQDYLKRPEGASRALTSQAAGSTTRPLRAFGSATRPTPDFYCATLSAANSTKSCCARAVCFRGRKRAVVSRQSLVASKNNSSHFAPPRMTRVAKPDHTKELTAQ